MAVCSQVHTKQINTLFGQKLTPLFVQRKSTINAISYLLPNMPNYASTFPNYLNSRTPETQVVYTFNFEFGMDRSTKEVDLYPEYPLCNTFSANKHILYRYTYIQ